MRKEDSGEKQFIDKIIDIRRIEAREKLERAGSQIITSDDVGKKLENFVINAYPGKQVNYVLNDYEKKDEVADKGKGDQKRNPKR